MDFDTFKETISEAVTSTHILPRILSFLNPKTDKLLDAFKIKSGFELQYLSS